MAAEASAHNNAARGREPMNDAQPRPFHVRIDRELTHPQVIGLTLRADGFGMSQG